MKQIFDAQLRQPDGGARLASIIVACTSLGFANAYGAPVNNTVEPAPPMYTVVNIGVSPNTVFLNQRGQVAYSSYNNGNANNVFFDGRRRYDIKAPGGRYTAVRGLNNLGVVVGEFDDGSTPPSNNRAFRWTAGGGLRALPGPGYAVAVAINDRNQAVGSVHEGTSYTRANRWNSDGTQTRLGPLPPGQSQANAINYSSVAVGVSDVEMDGSHAMVWDAAGSATDLGKFGGVGSVADFVNANNQVAGRYFTVPGPLGGTNTAGFFWSRAGGGVKILPFGWDNVTIEALNDNGKVAGNKMYPPGDLYQHTVPFIWCLQDGARLLPVGTFPNSRVLALNNRSQMVGFIQQADGQIATRRAVFWNAVSLPVDLNTRLYRAPAGLVLTSAKAINDHGFILADSNAGLVLLRPGRDISPGPVLGPITRTTAGDTVALNSTVDFAANFVGSSGTKTHAASAIIDDGCPQTEPSLREVRGQGDISVRHTFCKAGTFNVKVKVTDRLGNTAEVQSLQFVSDPAIATLMGRGVLTSQSKQPTNTGEHPMQVTLWVPLADDGVSNTARRGKGFVNASGPFDFHAEVEGAPVRNAQSIQINGTGRLNGRAGYRFSLDSSTNSDLGGDVNRLHLRITHQDMDSHSEVVDFDNAAGVASIMARPDGMAIVEGGVRLVGGKPTR